MKNKKTREEIESAAAKSSSIAGVCRLLKLVPSGGNYRIIHNAIEKYKIDTSHFTGQGWNINLKFKPFEGKKIEEILVKNSTYQSYKLKKRLIAEGIKKSVCESCGQSEWLEQPIPLELHHINGNNSDNRLENLRLLCPNCHALTDSYRGKNKRKLWCWMNDRWNSTSFSTTSTVQSEPRDIRQINPYLFVKTTDWWRRHCLTT